MTDYKKLRELAEAATPRLIRYVDRFLAKTVADGDCLLWTGAVAGKPGRKYGCAWMGEPIKAHRFSFLVWNGALDDTLMVCHRCDRPLCVNPEHLYQGTNTDNVRDAVERGRHRNGESDKTHCPSGHPYSDENTYRYKNQRQCRICRDIHRGRTPKIEVQYGC